MINLKTFKVIHSHFENENFVSTLNIDDPVIGNGIIEVKFPANSKVSRATRTAAIVKFYYGRGPVAFNLARYYDLSGVNFTGRVKSISESMSESNVDIDFERYIPCIIRMMSEQGF